MLKPDPYFKGDHLYYFSLGMLLASLPLSKFGMSLSQILLAGSWLITCIEIPTGNTGRLNALSRSDLLKEYGSTFTKSVLSRFKETVHNKTVLVVLSVYLLFVAGLIFTSDFNYAFSDLRNKLPLLILPIIISTGPRLNDKLLFRLLLIYLSAIVISACYQWILFHLSGKTDIREVNTHISHIRYSMNAVFGIAVSLFLVLNGKVKIRGLQLAFIANAIFISFFLFFMGYTTGIFLLALVVFAYVGWRLMKNRYWWQLISFMLIVLFSVGFVTSLVYQRMNEKHAIMSFDKLDKATANGNSYVHDTINFPFEDGQYSGLYICEKELTTSWKRCSILPIEGVDGKQQPLRKTLIRYLASCGLRKDSAGVSQLKENDIRNIEKGLANRNLQSKLNISTQLDNLFAAWHNYRIYHNPNGNSLIQRVEYWKTAGHIIRNNWLTGVGTGDVADSFKQQYITDQTHLLQKFRLRAHDQYLTVLLSLGIFGLIAFLFVLLYPGTVTQKFNNWNYFIFMLIMVFSMLTEDTLESQEGITFFACMNAILLFGKRIK